MDVLEKVEMFKGFFIRCDGSVKNEINAIKHFDWNFGVHLKQSSFLSVNIPTKTNPSNEFVHFLVAHFFVPNPKNFSGVKHKNCILTDNRASNLEWFECETPFPKWLQKHPKHFRLNNIYHKGDFKMKPKSYIMYNSMTCAYEVFVDGCLHKSYIKYEDAQDELNRLERIAYEKHLTKTESKENLKELIEEINHNLSCLQNNLMTLCLRL